MPDNKKSVTDSDRILSLMKGKKRRTRTVTITVSGEAVQIEFTALSANELDKLRAKHPPTKAQIADGLGINIETFQPALVAATMTSPKISEDDAKEMWEGDGWTRGELSELFETASSICMVGFDVPSNASA